MEMAVDHATGSTVQRGNAVTSDAYGNVTTSSAAVEAIRDVETGVTSVVKEESHARVDEQGLVAAESSVTQITKDEVTGTMVKTVDAIHDENGEVQLLHEEDTVVVDAEGRQHVIHDADYQATDAEGHVATKHVHADTVRDEATGNMLTITDTT